MRFGEFMAAIAIDHGGDHRIVGHNVFPDSEVNVPDDEGGDQPHAQSVPTVNIDGVAAGPLEKFNHIAERRKDGVLAMLAKQSETGEDHKYR